MISFPKYSSWAFIIWTRILECRGAAQPAIKKKPIAKRKYIKKLIRLLAKTTAQARSDKVRHFFTSSPSLLLAKEKGAEGGLRLKPILFGIYPRALAFDPGIRFPQPLDKNLQQLQGDERMLYQNVNQIIPGNSKHHAGRDRIGAGGTRFIVKQRHFAEAFPRDKVGKVD
jgi:hypothetical protein